MIRQANSPRRLAQGYARLANSVVFLSRFRILPFSENAIAAFTQLSKSKLHVRFNDLRIAAIALENGATVVTRNLRDFNLVPGLIVEDWSRP
jgi:tRNA(fMet)-specific endonuclease VapC